MKIPRLVKGLSVAAIVSGAQLATPVQAFAVAASKPHAALELPNAETIGEQNLRLIYGLARREMPKEGTPSQRLLRRVTKFLPVLLGGETAAKIVICAAAADTFSEFRQCAKRVASQFSSDCGQSSTPPPPRRPN